MDKQKGILDMVRSDLAAVRRIDWILVGLIAGSVSLFAYLAISIWESVGELFPG